MYRLSSFLLSGTLHAGRVVVECRNKRGGVIAPPYPEYIMGSKIFKGFLVLSGLLTLFIFNTKSAEAYNPYLISQTTNNATSTTREVVQSDVKYFYQELGTGLSGTIDRVVFENVSSGLSGSGAVSISRCDTNATPINCSGGVYIDTIYYTKSTSTTEYALTWTSPITLDPTKYYYLLFTNSSAAVNMTFSGSASDTYTNGACKWIDYPSAPIACGGISDIYFSLGDVPGDDIDLEFPMDDSLISADFTSFFTRASYAYLDGEFKVRIRYGVSTGLEFYDETTATSSFPFIASNFGVSVAKTIPLTAGFTYYARAELYRDSTLIASSAIHEFTILDPTGGTIGYIDQERFVDEIADLFPSDDCSTFEGSIFSSSTLEALGCVSKNVFQDVFKFLLKPTDLSLGFVDDTFKSYQSIFPFSIVFKSNDAIRSAIESAKEDNAANITFNTTFHSGNPISITILSSSTMVNFFGDDLVNEWYNIILAFALAGLAVFAFKFVIHHI